MKVKIYTNTFLRDPPPPSHNHATNCKNSPDSQCLSTEVPWARWDLFCYDQEMGHHGWQKTWSRCT